MSSRAKLPGELLEGTHYVFRHPSMYNDKKEIVICVHGIGSSHAHFAMFSRFLVNQGYHVLCYDMMGRGYSPPPLDHRYDGDAHVQQLYNLLKNLQLLNTNTTTIQPRRYHLVGHSMGGAVVTLFASKYPELVKSLILLAPAGLLYNRWLSLLHSVHCFHGLIHQTFIDQLTAAIQSQRDKNNNNATANVSDMHQNHQMNPSLNILTSDLDHQDIILLEETENNELSNNNNQNVSTTSFSWLTSSSNKNNINKSSSSSSSSKKNKSPTERLGSLNSPTIVAEAYWQCLLHFPLANITSEIKELVYRQQKQDKTNLIPVYILWGKQDKTIPCENIYRWEKLLTKPKKKKESNCCCCTLQMKLLEDAEHALVMEYRYKREVFDLIVTFLQSSSS